jgi:hypothetical protein
VPHSGNVSAMSLSPVVISLSRYGRALGTRALGEKVATEIRGVKRATRALILDFASVRVASAPFLEEVALAMRAAVLSSPERFVLLANLNEDVKDTIELVLERRDFSLVAIDDEKLEILGGRPYLEETLTAALELGSFTAAELAPLLEQKLPNLHQRLTQLHEAGALTRREDSKVRRGRRLRFETPPLRELEPLLD